MKPESLQSIIEDLAACRSILNETLTNETPIEKSVREQREYEELIRAKSKADRIYMTEAWPAFNETKGVTWQGD